MFVLWSDLIVLMCGCVNILSNKENKFSLMRRNFNISIFIIIYVCMDVKFESNLYTLHACNLLSGDDATYTEMGLERGGTIR